MRDWSHDQTESVFPEVRARAVRLAQEREAEHVSRWAAITAIVTKIGSSAETPRHWVRHV